MSHGIVIATPLQSRSRVRIESLVILKLKLLYQDGNKKTYVMPNNFVALNPRDSRLALASVLTMNRCVMMCRR